MVEASPNLHFGYVIKKMAKSLTSWYAIKETSAINELAKVGCIHIFRCAKLREASTQRIPESFNSVGVCSSNGVFKSF